MKFKVGIKSVANYTRMAYSLEYALAELIDNSIQAYLDEKIAMDKVYKKENKKLEIRITYDKNAGAMSVSDYSTGIAKSRLEDAMNLGGDMDRQDANRSLGEFNIGMKAASIWLAEIFKITTKRYDEQVENTVIVDTRRLFAGDGDLEEDHKNVKTGGHYTKIEYEGLRHDFSTWQIKRAKEQIASMYRRFLNKSVYIYFNGEKLEWHDWVLHKNPDTNKAYQWTIPKGYVGQIGHEVSGWLGILKVGAEGEEIGKSAGPKNAGISILRRGRVIKGQPDAWFPESVFGTTRAGLTHQRIVGEIEFDDAHVSQTKDAISPDHLEVMNAFLGQLATDIGIKKIANGIRLSKIEVTKTDTEDALESLEKVISKSDLGKKQNYVIPPVNAIETKNSQIYKTINKDNSVKYHLGNFIINLINEPLGEDDPFVVYQKEKTSNELTMIVNLDHPYLTNNYTSLDNYYLFLVMLVSSRFKIESDKRLSMDDFFDVTDEMMRFEVTKD
jgi:hypothetical protein